MEQIRLDAQLDFLTKVANRRAFDTRLTEEFERAREWTRKNCKEGKHKHGKKDKDCDKEKCKLGSIERLDETKFNDEGYPVHTKTTSPECSSHASEEWFKIEKDGLGNVISITGYSNEALDSLNESNSKHLFTYNDKGMVSKYEEYRYNVETKKFDRFHSAKTIEWNDPGLAGDLYLCPTYKAESYCLHRKVYSMKKRTVEKYGNGEEIIMIESGSKESDGPDPDMELKPDKKVTVKYEVIQEK